MISFKKNTLSLNSTLFAFAQIFDFQAKSKPENSQNASKQAFQNPFNKLNFEKIKKIKDGISKKALIVVAVILVVAIGGWYFTQNNGTNGASDPSNINLSPSGTANLNRKVEFPIRNRDGKETENKLTVTFTSLERANKVLYSGKPLIAKQGKDFIISNIEIENTTKDRLTVRPVDFIRLVDNEGRNYAADLQTNPLKVEPLSIKKTRTIFIASEDMKTLKLLIGEINGNRETVEVTL